MKLFIAIGFAIVFVLFGFKQNVFACSCDLPTRNTSLKQQVKQALTKSDAVFTGEVTEVRDNKFSHIVKIKVESKWKGIKDSNVIIFTGKGNGDCGYLFAVGEKYLIYAYKSNNEKLSTNICQRTNLLSESQADINVINKKR